MKPLLIKANLERGFSANDAWSPAIDGIIAYFQLRERMGDQAFHLSSALNEQSIVDDLPLKKVFHADKWWWACSSPEYDLKHEIVRAFYKKFNIDTSLIIKQKAKSIDLTKGQFKNYSTFFREIITKQVSWHVIGDEDEIKRILSMCRQIGAQRGKGMGVVESWSVTDSSDVRKAMFNRPIPVDAAEHNNVIGIKAWRGFRPSVRIAENQALCILPSAVFEL